MSLAAFRAGLRSSQRLSRAYHPTPRRSSLFQRIWYRPDGTRRSKLKGLIYVSAVTFASVMYLGTSIFLKEQPAFVFVAKLQQIDSKYPIDDSSTLSDVIAYIRAVGDIISLIYPDLGPEYMAEIADAHQNFSQVSPQHGENVRKILQDVHEIFRRGDQPFTEDTAHEVLETFDKFRVETWKMKEAFVSGKDEKS